MKKLTTIAALVSVHFLFCGQITPIPGIGPSLQVVGSNNPIVDLVMSNYTSSPSPMVPNSASTATASHNVIRAPRRLFSNGAWWNITGGTVTDNTAIAPDGSMQASTFTSAGAWSEFYAGQSGTPTSGTYTEACFGKAIGSNQTFNLNVIETGGTNHVSPSLTLTTTGYNLFTFPMSLSGSFPISIGLKGSSAVDADFVDCGLYQGAYSAEPPLSGHLYLGYSPWQSQPTLGPANAYIDFNTGFGLSQLPASTTLYSTCGAAVVQQKGPPITQASFLREATNFANFWMVTQYSSTLSAGLFYGTGQIGAIVGMWNINNTGFHVITECYDGTYSTIWFDDVAVLNSVDCFGASCTSSTVNTGPAIVTDLLVGVTAATGIGAGYQLAEIQLYSHPMNNAQVQANVYTLISKYAGSLGTSLYPAYVFATGDSIPASTGDWLPVVTAAFPELYTANATQFGQTPTVGFNFSFPATGVAYEQALEPYLSTILPPPSHRSGRHFVMMGAWGTNDTGLFDASPANYAAANGAVCDSWIASGFDLPTFATIIDRSSFSGTDITNAITYNNILTNSWGHCNNNIVNTTQDPWLGLLGSGRANNGLVYYEGPLGGTPGVHPLQPGHNIYDIYEENLLSSLGFTPPKAARFYAAQNTAYVAAIKGMWQ